MPRSSFEGPGRVRGSSVCSGASAGILVWFVIQKLTKKAFSRDRIESPLRWRRVGKRESGRGFLALSAIPLCASAVKGFPYTPASNVVLHINVPSTRARLGRQSRHRDRCRDDHRKWHLPCSLRDDAGGWLRQTCLSRVVCGWTAFIFRRTDLRRTWCDETSGGRRIRVRARRLRVSWWFSLCLDDPSHLETSVDCNSYAGIRAHSRYFLDFFVLSASDCA